MTKGYPVPSSRIAKRGFHGTDYDFTGEVLPKRQHGFQHFEFSGADDTYFLPGDRPENEQDAWVWAKARDFGQQHPAGRPRVHVTEPDPLQHTDYNLSEFRPETDYEWDTHARVAPRQRILDTNWAPPPKQFSGEDWDSGVSETHVEQTLPHINWRQMGLPNWKTHNVFGGVMDDQGMPLREESRYQPADRQQTFDASRNKHRPGPQVPGQLELPGTEYTKPRRGVF